MRDARSQIPAPSPLKASPKLMQCRRQGNLFNDFWIVLSDNLLQSPHRPGNRNIPKPCKFSLLFSSFDFYLFFTFLWQQEYKISRKSDQSRKVFGHHHQSFSAKCWQLHCQDNWQIDDGGFAGFSSVMCLCKCSWEKIDSVGGIYWG